MQHPTIGAALRALSIERANHYASRTVAPTGPRSDPIPEHLLPGTKTGFFEQAPTLQIGWAAPPPPHPPSQFWEPSKPVLREASFLGRQPGCPPYEAGKALYRPAFTAHRQNTMHSTQPCRELLSHTRNSTSNPQPSFATGFALRLESVAPEAPNLFATGFPLCPREPQP